MLETQHTTPHFNLSELLHSEGLNRLDQYFLEKLRHTHPDWHDQLLTYRNRSVAAPSLETSELLINCAKYLEQFIAEYFDITEPVAALQIKTLSHDPIFVFKKYFVLRRAKKELTKLNQFPSFAELNAWLLQALSTASMKASDNELNVALLGTELLNQPEKHQAEIEKLVQWCAHALGTPEATTHVTGWVSFHLPERLDYENLVPTIRTNQPYPGCQNTTEDTWRMRDGFKLTDPRMSAREVQDEVNYCIYCHDHDGDFCSKGFPVKKGDPSQGLKKNLLDNTLTGCPLEEKISEMNLLKKEGFSIAALAMVMVDNPMCPATGHRICNDCMKACIYQKQDPVNIPQIETRVLTDVLDLPWGVEVYDLLTRWNPLRQHQWVMKPYNGLKIMIAGMGPAGFTLAHHLLLEGFAVVGFDGLKIEPLAEKLLTQPIKYFSELRESLDERLMAGFGGVAEYGITVRWDKNFLKLIYLSLSRRPYFQVFGGIRFGGTITIDDAWAMGFDHFVIAVGAGLPKALPIPNSMAPGMRQANDFLMALQLGNAAKASSITNLQVRLPAVVIGGGLTGVDTATEVQAYYIQLVEKVLLRYEVLVKQFGEAVILAPLDAAAKNILQEYLQHGKAVREERKKAELEKRYPQFIKLIQQWGGVTIAYRRSLQESPAYINNHEELRKAFEEGIYYLEGVEPTAVVLDEYGLVTALTCQKRQRNEQGDWENTNDTLELKANAILVATGTQPNTAYEFEHRGTFNRLNLQYQHYEDQNGELTIAHGVEHNKDPAFGPFTSYDHQQYRVSLIGDTHPVFHGSVVKAIASGMRTYPKILAILHNKLGQRGNESEYAIFANNIRHTFSAAVIALSRKTPDIIELTIKAPLAAKHYRAGEFYRLQNFETHALHINDTVLQMEPLAVLPSACDAQKGTLTFLIPEHTATAKICATLNINEPVSLMGPTGVRAKIGGHHETVLIIGNQDSFAFTRSYGQALKAQANRLIFLCALRHPDENYCQSELEAVADHIIWSSPDQVVNALMDHAEQLADVDRIYVIGNTDLLRQFQQARRDLVKSVFIKDPTVVGSVYGNMQCMLKGVCAQCLQWQIDPETGKRTKAVFACSWQDQPLELIDISHIDQRQQQNLLLEHLNRLWIDHLLLKKSPKQS